MTQRPTAQRRIGVPCSRSESAALRFRDWMRGTGRGPLRRVWATAYHVAQIGVAAWLRHRAPDVTVYVRGSFGEGRPTYGFSDLDFVAIASDEKQADFLQRKTADTLEHHPTTAQAMDVAILNGSELPAAGKTPFYCRPATRLRPGEPALGATLGLNFFDHVRPWRRIGGPNRQVSGSISRAHRPQWTWLEVQFRWKHLLRTVAGVHDPQQASHVASGALVGLARAAAWMESGESGLSREEAVESALEFAPRFATTLQRAAQGGSEPDEILPAAAALTDSIATRIEELGGEPTFVELKGTGPSAGKEAPLVDWRSLTFPRDAGEVLIATPGAARDPALVRALSARSGRRRSAILDGRLLAMPIKPGSPGDTRAEWAWQLRAMQCATSDPVSWATASGRSTAVFLQHSGWSLQDWHALSARLPAEQLAAEAFRTATLDQRVAVLFAAVRTAALGRSMSEGHPMLPVSLDAAADEAADLHPRLRAAVEATTEYVQGEAGNLEPLDLEPWRTQALEALAQTSLTSLAQLAGHPLRVSLEPRASLAGG